MAWPFRPSQPIFHTYSIATSVSVKSGETVLLTVHDRLDKSKQDNLILELFTATVTSR